MKILFTIDRQEVCENDNGTYVVSLIVRKDDLHGRVVCKTVYVGVGWDPLIGGVVHG